MCSGLIGSRRVFSKAIATALDEVELAPGFPRTASEVVGVKEGEPERKNWAYSPAGPSRTTRTLGDKAPGRPRQ
jgi:hypothetical protein